MATVRPFPETPQLVMNPVMACSIATKTIETNNLITDIQAYSTGDPDAAPSDLGNLYKSSNITILKNQGLIDAQIDITQTDIFLAANLKLPNFEKFFNCDTIVKILNVETVNKFTIGNLNNNN